MKPQSPLSALRSPLSNLQSQVSGLRSPLTIAIDAHMVGERETGNETYTLSLIRALLALPPEQTAPVRIYEVPHE